MSNDYRTIKNLFEALTQETNSSTTGISFVWTQLHVLGGISHFWTQSHACLGVSFEWTQLHVDVHVGSNLYLKTITCICNRWLN
jgi:hypothetical protein